MKSKFVGEDLLKDSDINVDTNDHVVTLKGTVMSAAARARAVAQAKEVEGVHKVVDLLTIVERKLADFQAYYNTARSHASLEGHTPLTFAGGYTVARAELNSVRWVSHCRDLVQLPEAGLTTNSRRTGYGSGLMTQGSGSWLSLASEALSLSHNSWP